MSGSRPEARGKGRPKLSEAGDIDRNIRAAAMEVLRDHGEAATLHAVAQAAGLSRRSLYVRFPTKADLFLAVIRGILETAEPLQFERGKDFRETLCNYIEAGLLAVADPGAQAIQRLMLMNPDYISTLRAEMRVATDKIFVRPLTDLLETALRNCEIWPVNIDMVVSTITKLVIVQDEGFFDIHQADSEDVIKGRALFLAELLCSGLKGGE